MLYISIILIQVRGKNEKKYVGMTTAQKSIRIGIVGWIYKNKD